MSYSSDPLIIRVGQTPSANPPSDCPDQSGAERRYGVRSTSVGLAEILPVLLSDPTFAASDRPVILGTRIAVPAHQVFVPFESIGPEMVPTERVFWGQIRNMGFDSNGTFWFNTGPVGTFSFCMNSDQAMALLQRIRLGIEQVSGMFAIAFGSVHRSSAGKLYGCVRNQGDIALTRIQ